MSTSQRAASATFDPDLPYRCSPSVALRPEPFGALVYHFGTRKLSFLKTPQLVDVVSGLDQHCCAHEAIEAAGVAPEQRTAYLRALAGLAEAGTIERRTPVAKAADSSSDEDSTSSHP